MILGLLCFRGKQSEVICNTAEVTYFMNKESDVKRDASGSVWIIPCEHSLNQSCVSQCGEQSRRVMMKWYTSGNWSESETHLCHCTTPIRANTSGETQNKNLQILLVPMPRSLAPLLRLWRVRGCVCNSPLQLRYLLTYLLQTKCWTDMCVTPFTSHLQSSVVLRRQRGSSANHRVVLSRCWRVLEA